jgi:hypothetical protein
LLRQVRGEPEIALDTRSTYRREEIRYREDTHHINDRATALNLKTFGALESVSGRENILNSESVNSVESH